MYISLKIVNPPAGSKRAGPRSDVNGPWWAAPSNTVNKHKRPGWEKIQRTGLGLKI